MDHCNLIQLWVDVNIRNFFATLLHILYHLVLEPCAAWEKGNTLETTKD